MKRIVEGQVMDDAYTVRSAEPMKPGQRVIILTDWDAESIFELARFFAKQSRSEDAFQLLREHEEIVRQRFVFPYADAIVSTLLSEGFIEEALSFARRIEWQYEHDVALVRIAMHVFRKHGEHQRAKEILREVRDEKRRAWGEFLIDWSLRIQQLRQSQDELQNALQQLIDERGD
ncbi:MAG: hypothetical protein RMK89_02100 [Armatimonadota bacterium]|nr:hypothetical protein [Armatimonadota bacterium]MDW8142233.1 hypothetical protein [Armatimonadota bacterium]